VKFLDWEMPGGNRVERVFAALMLADWVSYYLAVLEDVDPTPVALVEEFKKRLKDAR
jgi:glucose/mannose-6-phosphate isomerase